jgi:uncharacterized protein (DUF2237 family)
VSGAPPERALSGAGAAFATPVPSPPEGLVSVRLDVDAARIDEARRAIEAAPVTLSASHVTELAEGSLAVEFWLEYRRLDDALALVTAFGAVARRVSPPRFWCPGCARWHESAAGGRAMLAAAGGACGRAGR